MSKEDIEMIWHKINCEACYNENINYCKEKCECKCREFKALENILKENKANKKRINELEIVILKDYISKFIIRETLEKLQEEYKIALEENSTKAFILKCKIEGIQELLKDGGE